MVVNKTFSSSFDCIKQCDLRGGPIKISLNENLFSTKIFSTIYIFEYTLIIKGPIALFVFRNTEFTDGPYTNPLYSAF